MIVKDSKELKDYIELLSVEEPNNAIQKELQQKLNEMNDKIAEAKRLIEPDYLDDEKIKEYIVEKSKTMTVHLIMTLFLIFVVPAIAIKLDNYFSVSEGTLIPVFIAVGFLLWFPMKFLYYVPREKRLEEFAEQNWRSSVLFESRWKKIKGIHTRQGMKYFLYFLNEEKQEIKTELPNKIQYDAFLSMKDGEKIVYVLRCPKEKSGNSYIPLCPMNFENKSSLKIQDCN